MVAVSNMKDEIVKILIDNDKSLGDIQREFSLHYLFLRIEFFKSNESNGLIRREKLKDEYRLDTKNSISINIGRDRTINDVKKDFFEKADLIVQIYRKSGNVWVETSHTNHWPLEQQNFEGEQMNRP
jgi:hypothetical protein